MSEPLLRSHLKAWLRPVFHDRAEAGRRLAQQLESYRATEALVLAIPRGGVPVAAEIARHLGAELDIVVARKIGSPVSPELALGAVTANGGLFLNEEILDMDVPPAYLNAVVARERAEARRREAQLRGLRPKASIAGRNVIIVDDGLATGATMRAALRSVRQQHPARLVVAIPVGARESCELLRAEADEVVCLHQPQPFIGVGFHYAHFEQTEDAEVQRLLLEAAACRTDLLSPAS